MARVTAKATKVEQTPKAYLHIDSGNIAFPMGHFDSAQVMVYSASEEIIKSSTSDWGKFKRATDASWVPMYDGETLTIIFGQE